MGHALTTAATALQALLVRAARSVETLGARSRLSQGFLARFSRVTSGGAFLPEIDGLRFIAISWVIALHLIWALNKEAGQSAAESGFLAFLYQRGRIGVPLFFIISGFILGMPFAKHYLCAGKAVSLPKYFIRRVTRLEPPYIIHLLLLTIGFIFAANLGLFHGQPNTAVHDTSAWFVLKHCLASICYQHNMIFGEANPINGILWSLEVEIQFYVLVPLLTLVFAIRSASFRRLVIVSVIIAFTCFSRTPWAHLSGRISGSILTELQWFMTGFLLVDMMLATPEEKLKPKLRWDLVSLIGWCALPLCEATPAIYGLTVPAAFLAYLGVFRGQVVGAFFRNPWISTIGGMCYTIYMYHFFLILFCTHRFVRLLHAQNFTLNLLLQTVVIGGFTLGVSAVLFLLFERPFMKRDWPQKTWAAVRSFAGRIRGIV